MNDLHEGRPAAASTQAAEPAGPAPPAPRPRPDHPGPEQSGPEQPPPPRSGRTHTLDFHADTVVKTYASWDRGEARREWRSLTLLAHHAPGHAPRPLAARLDLRPPRITMERLPGTPLRGTDVPPEAVEALADTLRAVHTAVPAAALARQPEAAWHAARLDARARAGLDHPALDPALPPTPEGPGPLARRALAEARVLVARESLAEHSGTRALVPVLGLADGNLANHLWDGERVRLVDFEDSGRCDRAFELATMCEHPSAWVDTRFDAELLLAHLAPAAPEAARLRHLRRLVAVLWLVAYLTDPGAIARNPPDTAERAADRLLTLLGAH
ncbi:aminoglycoside phosphotransferase family protein [Streptomyces sp. BI20]|uniref:aminoglycoside phosphotransferase family protein n=1 Tax=Streptomyces sp. BI20 TaxID=3403460 RepID=UPI003C752FF4